MPIATLRQAATVVVLRPRDTRSYDVLMVRRNDNVAFMAGAYVFPGGRLDEADASATEPRTERWASRFEDLSPREEQTYRAAAARGGGFRTRILSARSFGLIDNPRGQVALTPLGQRIVDPTQERAARSRPTVRRPRASSSRKRRSSSIRPTSFRSRIG